MVEKGHRPAENQVSRTSGSCTQPSGACSPGRRTRSRPRAVPDRDAVAHHSWREMHQSCMLSTTRTSAAPGRPGRSWCHRCGPRRRGLGEGFHLHPPLHGQARLDGLAGALGVADAVHVGELAAHHAASASRRSRIFRRASKRSMPSNSVPLSAILPVLSMMVGMGRLCAGRSRSRWDRARE